MDFKEEKKENALTKKTEIKNKKINIVSTILFVLAMILLVLIRFYLILELPVFAYIDYISDDELMVEQAVNIKAGKWLGTYGYNTLLKGPVFPMFLAIISTFKIPYIFSVTFMYVCACLIFLFSIKNIIKNKFGLLAVFILMLFNPIMNSTDFQRVYRNSLTPSLVILFMSFFNIALCSRKDEKIYKYLISIICASIVFPFLYYIREDSIWIVPFVCFYMLIIGSNIIIDSIRIRKISLRNVIKFVSLFLLIVGLFVFQIFIGNLNYKYYGEKIITMNDFESLQKAIHAINIVKNDPPTEATNPREKMRKLYEYSPTLNSMKDICEMLQDNISGKNGSVGDGMFGWVILETVSQSGYNTLEKQKEVFESIADEIHTAIAEGKLETQELTPFFNDAAGYKFDINRIWLETINALKLICDYKSFGLMDTYGSLYSSDVFETRIRYFLEATNDRLLLNNEPNSWRQFGELIKDNQQEYINRMQPKVDSLKYIRDVYYNIANIIIPAGYISYVILTIAVIVKAWKKNVKDILNNWIIASGLIGATFTLCVGIGYTSAIKVPLTIAFYLMSGYILNISFCIISIISVISIFVSLAKRRKMKLKVENDNTKM